MRLHVLPTLHPARILRGGWALDPAQRAYLDYAREVADALERGEEPEVVDVTQPPPGAVLAPNLADLTRWREEGRLEQGVAVDVEAAGPHIRCVGLCRLSDYSSIVVPFRRQGGASYWPNYHQLVAAVEWVDGVLGDPAIPLYFHYGQAYDIPEQLERTGFQVRGYAGDTFFMARLLYPEMPAKLGFLSTLWLRIPNWKWLVKQEEGEEK